MAPLPPAPSSMSGSDEVSDKKVVASTMVTEQNNRQGSIARGSILTVQDENEDVIVTWKMWMAAIAGAFCVFSGYYTGLLLGNTATAVVSTFGRPELATWMPNEFAIITAALGGLTGSVSDTIGRKWVLLGGLFICLVGNVLIAAAQDIAMVLLGAAMTAGLFCNQSNFFSIPAEVLPRRYRGVGATITVSAGGFGALVGLMFGGRTIQDNTGGLGWRSTYILGACINLVAITLLFFFYRPLESPKEEGVSTIQALKKQVDWVGSLLLAIGIGLLMIGLTMGGTMYAWSGGPVIGTLVSGAVVIGVLVIHQRFFNKHGILDHDLWTRNFCVASFGCFVEGIVFYALLLFFPLETQALWESRPFYINVRLLAFFATSAVVAPFVGLYTRHTKDLKYPLLVGWALVLIGIIVLTTAGKSSNNSSIGGLFIIGVGFATPLALLFATAQLATAPHLLGLTTGQLISFRAIGQAVGASVLVAVFKAQVKEILPAKVSSAVTKAGLPADSVLSFIEAISAGNSTLLQAVPGVTPSIIEAGSEAATDAYVQSFHYGWDTALPFAIIALLLVFLLDGKKIKEQMTWLVERPVAVIEHVHHDLEHGEKTTGRS